MAEVINIGSNIVEIYQLFLSVLPFWAKNFVNLFLIAAVIFIYAVFIWKFYRFIAKKNIIELNLKKYNNSSNPTVLKTMAGIYYFLEYLIILPLLVFIWFGVFTIFLILLTESIELSRLLIISVTIITAIRFAAYFKEDLAKDLAKLLPFTLLGVSLTQNTMFSFPKILGQISELPAFFESIIIYLVFVMVIEFLLRLSDFFLNIGGIPTDEVKEEIKEEVKE